MAKLAKEATTTRRVLESLFRCFDNGKLWPAHHGLAFPVLKDMQFLMDDSGIYLDYYLALSPYKLQDPLKCLSVPILIILCTKVSFGNVEIFFIFQRGLIFLNSKTWNKERI